MEKRHILVTSALPYANGSIHLGHMLEHIQTDIWVRFQKLRGHECRYMCADDSHGTPIMLSARKEGVTPEELVKKYHIEHQADFKDFLIGHDIYYTTHSEENRKRSEEIYNIAKDKGVIYTKEIEQLYDKKEGMFLPDRMISGSCPRCEAEGQHGDSCESCGATYSPTELKDPVSVISGDKPILKKSTHYFFKLSEFTEDLKKWVAGDHIEAEIKNKLQEWFDEGIRDWDISRDAPYFGFKIPGTEDKYFYVWLDAPVGYMAATEKWASENGKNFDDIWKGDTYEIHHFIGKDILYFHTLFWPAMLMVSGYQTPKRINVHGFLTINGEKMSKSRGTFILARAYLDRLNPEYFRYYLAAKLTPKVEDLDFSFEDFVFKVNSDIVGKVVNIGSRLGSILNKKLDGKLTEPDEDGETLLREMRQRIPEVTEDYEHLRYHHAIRHIMEMADKANKYVDQKAPWSVVKEDAEAAAGICTSGLNALRILAGLLKPVMPNIAKGVETFLRCPPITWNNLDMNLMHTRINPYEHLASRIELGDVLELKEGRD
ncbi:MAG: methionine--tRNA ligase [Candidatus Margulisbacteria bacterium]|nr:methionine--tRNA ligase [Candidatus Margulisiibacteriota bacterium]